MDQPAGSVLTASFPTAHEAEACLGRLRVAGFHPSMGAGLAATAVFVPEAEGFAAGHFLGQQSKANTARRSPAIKLGGVFGLLAGLAAMTAAVIALVRMLQYLDGLRGH